MEEERVHPHTAIEFFKLNESNPNLTQVGLVLFHYCDRIGYGFGQCVQHLHVFQNPTINRPMSTGMFGCSSSWASPQQCLNPSPNFRADPHIVINKYQRTSTYLLINRVAPLFFPQFFSCARHYSELEKYTPNLEIFVTVSAISGYFTKSWQRRFRACKGQRIGIM